MPSISNLHIGDHVYVKVEKGDDDWKPEVVQDKYPIDSIDKSKYNQQPYPYLLKLFEKNKRGNERIILLPKDSDKK